MTVAITCRMLSVAAAEGLTAVTCRYSTWAQEVLAHRQRFTRMASYCRGGTKSCPPVPTLRSQLVGRKRHPPLFCAISSLRTSVPLAKTCVTTAWKQQIDVMFLYDEAVLERYSVDYLETLIADELPTSTEAAVNSLIDLRFNLIHTGKASDDIPELCFSAKKTEVAVLGLTR